MMSSLSVASTEIANSGKVRANWKHHKFIQIVKYLKCGEKFHHHKFI